MRNITLFAIAFAFFCSPFALKVSHADSLAQVVSGEGELVFLKGETVTPFDRSGSPISIQQVFYQGDYHTVAPQAPSDKYVINLGNLSCIGVFNTLYYNHELHNDPYINAVIPEGTVLKWAMDSDLDGDRWSTTQADNGAVTQILNLTFYGDDSPLTAMTCDIVSQGKQPTLSVSDFIRATGGRMTLRASK